jgi:hypothetical protein
MRPSDDLMHKSVLSRSMREPIPTRPLESPNDVWFNFFKMNCTISLTSLDSAYQIQGTSVSKTKVIQKKVNRIMKIMQSIIWYAY